MVLRLSDAAKNNNYTVLELNLAEKIKKRLEILGMTHNSVLKVLNKKKNGPMIIKVRGTRFALSKDVCDGILLVFGERI